MLQVADQGASKPCPIGATSMPGVGRSFPHFDARSSASPGATVGLLAPPVSPSPPAGHSLPSMGCVAPLRRHSASPKGRHQRSLCPARKHGVSKERAGRAELCADNVCASSRMTLRRRRPGARQSEWPASLMDCCSREIHLPRRRLLRQEESSATPRIETTRRSPTRPEGPTLGELALTERACSPRGTAWHAVGRTDRWRPAAPHACPIRRSGPSPTPECDRRGGPCSSGGR